MKIEYELFEQRKKDRPRRRMGLTSVEIDPRLARDDKALLKELDRLLENAAELKRVKRQDALLRWKIPYRTDWREHR
jgi:hypothetical protein